MDTTGIQLLAAARIAIAGLIGLGVGLEREWSGHASGPDARFAGLRTFLILGLLGGAAGLLLREGHELIAAAIVIGAAGMCIAAYALSITSTSDRDGTTEVAAIAVVALGAVAAGFSMFVAAAAGSVVVLALSEKQRLHTAVSRLRREEMSGALQFAVLAIVVLPLLPEGPYLGWLEVRPRSLWLIVLLFCALNFAGFIAKRTTGEGRGYLLTGLLGGVISSTAVTFGFARTSRQNPEASAPLAAGVIAACTVLVPRVLIISAVLNPPVALGLVRYIAPAGLIGLVVVAWAWRFGKRWKSHGDANAAPSWLGGTDRSPLRLLVAIQLAVVFQLAIIAIRWIRDQWTVEGLYGTAALLGLTNADALTVSMSAPTTDMLPTVAARAIAIGILVNTLVKLGISAAAGSARFRLMSVAVLLVMAASIAAPLLLV
jgi:uncharacterized membrane protein (DUF4010 family)